MKEKLARLMRARKYRRDEKRNRIPGWWEFEVDCACSNKWYRCNNCETCDWENEEAR